MSCRKSQSLEGEPPLLGSIMLGAKSQSHGIPAHPSPTVKHLLTPGPGPGLALI